MASDPDPGLERDYRYRAGCGVMGCAFLFVAGLGAGGCALVPVGCEQFRNGQKVLGGVLVGVGVVVSPLTLMAVLVLGMALRDLTRPPLLRVTPTALWLPKSLRGEVTKDSTTEDTPPPDPTNLLRQQPEEIPFATIRWVRREVGPVARAERLVIVHDLSPTRLTIEISMMRTEDFEELETVLRAAIPRAFLAAPATDPPEEE